MADIIKTTADIDSKFAQIIRELSKNDYNRGNPYNDGVVRSNPLPFKGGPVAQGHYDQLDPAVRVKDIPKNLQRDLIADTSKPYNNVSIRSDPQTNKNDYDRKRQYDIEIKRAYRNGDTLLLQALKKLQTRAISQNRYNGQTSVRQYDQQDTNYTGDSNSVTYVRFLKKQTVARLSRKAQQRYKNIEKSNNPLPYNSDPNRSPYDPVAFPFNLSDLSQVLQKLSSGHPQSLITGLGQYYFGFHMRFRRAFARSSGAYKWNIASFIAYNSLRGLLSNMTPTPLSFTLGFDIPLIGPLSINKLGPTQFLQSKYGDPSTPLLGGTKDSQLHTMGGIPGYGSGLVQLQKGIAPRQMRESDFYQSIAIARQTGQATKWQRRTTAQQVIKSKRMKRVSAFVRKKFKKVGSKLIGEKKLRPLKSKYFADTQYVKRKTAQFHKLLKTDGSDKDAIFITIQHKQTNPSLSADSFKKFLATVQNFTDGANANWQDVWINTGRFQPIKVYDSVSRNMQLSFKLFAYQLFNDVDMIKDTIDSIDYWVNKNQYMNDDQRLQYSKGYQSSYRQSVNWLMQLPYPKFQPINNPNRSITRYNVDTKFSFGDYIVKAPVFINNVSVTPSDNFFWIGKFPMMLNISLSMTVFRSVDINGIINDTAVKRYEDINNTKDSSVSNGQLSTVA